MNWAIGIIGLLFIIFFGCATTPLTPSDDKILYANDSTQANSSINTSLVENVSLSGFENVTIKLEIHDNLPKSLRIQNGIVVFTEGDKIDQVEISSEKLESLTQLIIKNDFFSLNERYEGSGCCDFIGNTITVIIGNKTHSVYCYNECPDNFREMEREIKSTWPYKIQYVGFA